LNKKKLKAEVLNAQRDALKAMSAKVNERIESANSGATVGITVRDFAQRLDLCQYVVLRLAEQEHLFTEIYKGGAIGSFLIGKGRLNIEERSN